MAYVYIHKKSDNGEPFYVGIGNSPNHKRAHDMVVRNKFWKHIFNRHKILIEIYKDDISWEEAKNIEKELILKYGRRNNGTGILCNLTNGGDGCLGLVHTKDTLIKMSEWQKTRKRKPHPESTRRKMSLKKKGVSKIWLYVWKDGVLCGVYDSYAECAGAIGYNKRRISAAKIRQSETKDGYSFTTFNKSAGSWIQKSNIDYPDLNTPEIQDYLTKQYGNEY